MNDRFGGRVDSRVRVAEGGARDEFVRQHVLQVLRLDGTPGFVKADLFPVVCELNKAGIRTVVDEAAVRSNEVDPNRPNISAGGVWFTPVPGGVLCGTKDEIGWLFRNPHKLADLMRHGGCRPGLLPPGTA